MYKKRKPNKAITAKSIADSISLIASIIGIFGFLTGISSIPVWLAGDSGNVNTANWMDKIPFTVSITAFAITVIFVYGFYFVIAIRINRWLYSQGIIHSQLPSHFHFLNSLFYNLSNPSDLFALFCLVTVGSGLGFLIIRAFFGEELLEILPYALVMLVFVIWLCVVAKNVATELHQSHDTRNEIPDWSTTIANVRLALSKMYDCKPEEIEIKDWHPQLGGTGIYLRILLKERLWGKIVQSEYNVTANMQGKILKCDRTIHVI